MDNLKAFRDTGVITGTYVDFSILLYKTLSKINTTSDDVEFITTDNEKFILFHQQDCCESVTVEDICGNLNDLIGPPILLAEESTNNENHPKDNLKTGDESFTWTFYRLATVKGAVTIRFYGSSNGYYSESVDFIQVKQNN